MITTGISVFLERNFLLHQNGTPQKEWKKFFPCMLMISSRSHQIKQSSAEQVQPVENILHLFFFFLSLVCCVAFVAVLNTSVISKFFAFENVTIATSTLARSWCYTSIQSSSSELFLKMRINLERSFPCIHLALRVVWSLLVQHIRFFTFNRFSSLLTSKGNCIVTLKPLPKGSGIHWHNAALYKGLGSHQLIAAGILYNVNDTTLAGDTFRSRGIIAGVKS